MYKLASRWCRHLVADTRATCARHDCCLPPARRDTVALPPSPSSSSRAGHHGGICLGLRGLAVQPRPAPRKRLKQVDCSDLGQPESGVGPRCRCLSRYVCADLANRRGPERCVLGAGRNAAADCNPVCAPHIVAVLDAGQTAEELATFGGTVCRTRHGIAVPIAILSPINVSVNATNASSWHYTRTLAPTATTTSPAYAGDVEPGGDGDFTVNSTGGDGPRGSRQLTDVVLGVGGALV